MPGDAPGTGPRRRAPKRQQRLHQLVEQVAEETGASSSTTPLAGLRGEVLALLEERRRLREALRLPAATWSWRAPRGGVEAGGPLRAAGLEAERSALTAEIAALRARLSAAGAPRPDARAAGLPWSSRRLLASVVFLVSLAVVLLGLVLVLRS